MWWNKTLSDVGRYTFLFIKKSMRRKESLLIDRCTKNKRENFYVLLMRISVKSFNVWEARKPANVKKHAVNVLTAHLTAAVPRLDGPGLLGMVYSRTSCSVKLLCTR